MDAEELRALVQQRLSEYQKPKRKAFSRQFPLLKPLFISAHRLARYGLNFSQLSNLNLKQSDVFFPNLVARHSSVLMRKLGDTDQRLQQQKIINLKLAAEKINGVIIPPNKIFSFWHVVGNPSEERGYVSGMLLSEGKVIEGIGGGLCQLSNLLFWLFLHSPTEIVERYHHSRDVFPDSGRVLPFGSGATIFYNYTDLKVKNISPVPIQLKIWLTDKFLEGKILSPSSLHTKYHIFETNHCFVVHNGQYFRFNQLWREVRINGKLIETTDVATNFAPVMYQVDEEVLKENGQVVIEI